MLWWVAGLVRAVEERRAPEPLLLLAMLLWANLHGGFTLGLLLTGAFALEALVGARDPVERKMIFVGWAKFGVAALLVACITPYGAGSILVTLRIFGIGDALALIAEWKSPDFQSQPLMELILLIALYLALSRGVKLPLVRVLIVIGLMHLFLRYARNAELLATLAPLAIAPVLARQWPALRRDPDAGRKPLVADRRRPSGRNAALALCVASPLSISPAWSARRHRAAADDAPTAALDFAREAGPQGPRAQSLRLRRLPDQCRRPDLHRRSRRALSAASSSSVRRGDPPARRGSAREDARSLGFAGPCCSRTSRPTSCSPACRAGARPMPTTRR